MIHQAKRAGPEIIPVVSQGDNAGLAVHRDSPGSRGDRSGGGLSDVIRRHGQGADAIDGNRSKDDSVQVRNIRQSAGSSG